MRHGLLLVNLGTPDAPDTASVRRYLAEFLSDPRVLDIAPAARWLLLHGVILRRRPAESAAAYRSVWTDEGSPFRVFGNAFRDALAAEVAPMPVELGMRYGGPSIEDALGRLVDAGVDAPIVWPLYPQSASSSTGTALEAVYRACAERWSTPYLRVIPPFYDEPAFLAPFASNIRQSIDQTRADHVLFSYHGLPERHLRKGKPTAISSTCMEAADCCAQIDEGNAGCYRAHCFATTRGILARLDRDVPHTTTFQSRLGRDPWIKPFTDHVLEQLAQDGVKRLVVACPSFVTDCLETLEEIAMRERERFLGAGGEALQLVPSLNADSTWVKGAADLVRRHLPQ